MSKNDPPYCLNSLSLPLISSLPCKHGDSYEWGTESRKDPPFRRQPLESYCLRDVRPEIWWCRTLPVYRSPKDYLQIKKIINVDKDIKKNKVVLGNEMIYEFNEFEVRKVTIQWVKMFKVIRWLIWFRSLRWVILLRL